MPVGSIAARIIMLTIHRQDRHVLEAIKAGARGYLLKDVDERELIGAIRSVHQVRPLLTANSPPGCSMNLVTSARPR
jgi:DNA-binding NarL/FixJ family response regulator